jgi:hypothetical protein
MKIFKKFPHFYMFKENGKSGGGGGGVLGGVMQLVGKASLLTFQLVRELLQSGEHGSETT